MSEASGPSRAAKGDGVTDRVMSGETPLQALARQGELPASRMRSIERFPYYTAFPFAWYRACHSDRVPRGGLLPLRLLSRVVPARWFVLVARGIMLKGIGLTYLWSATLVLLFMALFLLTASTRSFHERLE